MTEKEREYMAIYKAYIRKLIRDLEDVKSCLEKKDIKKAEQLIDILIKDSRQDLEH